MRHAEARTLRVFAINPRNLAGHTDRGSHRGARQIHNRLTRFSSHLISYFYHRAPLRCGATRAYHQRPAQGGLALAPADKDQRRGPPQRPQQPFLFPPYSLFLSSSSATLRRHSRIPRHTPHQRPAHQRSRQGHSPCSAPTATPCLRGLNFACGVRRELATRTRHQRQRGMLLPVYTNKNSPRLDRIFSGIFLHISQYEPSPQALARCARIPYITGSR